MINLKTESRLLRVHTLCLFFLSFLLIFIAFSPAAGQNRFPANRGDLVNDFAGVLSSSQRQQINAVVNELLQKTEIPVVVVTMPDIGGAEYNDYANRLYEEWGIGKKGVDAGVLIFLTVQERGMRIETGYGVEGILPDGLAGDIADSYMVPFFRQDMFGEGLLNGTMAVALTIAKSEGVELTGQVRVTRPEPERGSGLAFLPVLIIIIFMIMGGRGRGRGRWLLLPLLLSGGRMGGYRGSSGGGIGGGFGGFGGGFGGFGGGMSGGGGIGRSF